MHVLHAGLVAANKRLTNTVDRAADLSFTYFVLRRTRAQIACSVRSLCLQQYVERQHLDHEFASSSTKAIRADWRPEGTSWEAQFARDLSALLQVIL